MTRLLMSLAALATLTMGAAAQTPPPAEPAPAQPAAPASPNDTAAPKPAAADSKPSTETSADAKSGSGDTATQETYKMKNGQMYQPPKVRPASPAQNLDVYGRT